MAEFVGTKNEFLKFIGPYCRNKVNTITQSERKKYKKTCQHCNQSNVELEAAHIAGQERNVIIEFILESYFKFDANHYKIDLKEFEILFVNYQMPISDHFLFLCKDCHRAYDFNTLAIKQNLEDNKLINIDVNLLNKYTNQPEIHTQEELPSDKIISLYKAWLKDVKFKNDDNISIQIHIDTLIDIIKIYNIENFLQLIQKLDQLIYNIENNKTTPTHYLRILRTFKEFLKSHKEINTNNKNNIQLSPYTKLTPSSSQDLIKTHSISDKDTSNNSIHGLTKPNLNTTSNDVFMQCKKTAGCWFIVKYLKDIEKNYDNLLDMDFKRNYAKKIFNESKRDCDVKNTIIRINCMLKLVKYNLVDYAYNYAINSNWY